MSKNGSFILDAVQATAARHAAESAAQEEAKRLHLSQVEALWPEVRAILGPLAEESDVVPGSEDYPRHVEWRVLPRLWRGEIGFTLAREDGRVRPEWKVFSGYHAAYVVTSADDWLKPPLAGILDYLHQMAVERLADLIGAAVADLSRAETEEEARDAHAELVRLAPERAAEWDALLAERLDIHEAEAARWAERHEDFAAYLRDLRMWRQKYAETLAINRAEAIMLQQKYDASFTGYEVGFTAAPTADDDDADGVPHVFTVWAVRGEPDEFGYWSIYTDDGIVSRYLTRVLWVGEGIAARAAETPGPWRLSVWVEPAGQWVHCPRQWKAACQHLAAEATGNRFTPLPEEPAVTDYGSVFADGLTDYEHGRIHEVVGDMQLADVPF